MSPAPANIPAAPPSHTAASVAAALGAELRGTGTVSLTGLNTLESAGPGDLTFIRDAKYASAWIGSKAGACLVSKGVELPALPENGRAVLIVPDADLALIKAIGLFKPPEAPPAAGVHPSAVVDPSARISPSASIGAMCVVGPACVIADGCVLHPHVTLGREVRIGPRTVLASGVVVHDRCIIGASCLLHANAVVGADGFGFRASPDGRGVVKIPHIGNVEIHDHVELGACTCVDRGKLGPTVIGAGTKIDNLVQIAHNARIGRSCLIAGCTGISGSAVIGDGVQIGGHAGIGDNVTVGAGAQIGAFTAVMRDVAPGQVVLGVPAEPAMQFMRKLAWLRRQIGLRGRAGWNESRSSGD